MATELGQFFIVWALYLGGQEGVARDWDGPEGGIY